MGASMYGVPPADAPKPRRAVPPAQLQAGHVSGVNRGEIQRVIRKNYEVKQQRLDGMSKSAPERTELERELRTHPGNPAAARPSAAARLDERERERVRHTRDER